MKNTWMSLKSYLGNPVKLANVNYLSNMNSEDYENLWRWLQIPFKNPVRFAHVKSILALTVAFISIYYIAILLKRLFIDM